MLATAVQAHLLAEQFNVVQTFRMTVVGNNPCMQPAIDDAGFNVVERFNGDIYRRARRKIPELLDCLTDFCLWVGGRLLEKPNGQRAGQLAVHIHDAGAKSVNVVQ